MSEQRPVQLTTGLAETILPDPAPGLAEALAGAGADRDAVAALVARAPRSVDVWAALGAVGRDDIESYAAYRVGYHRGLDALRANGWRGSGYVRWSRPSNRAFLRCLEGLRAKAEAIGEQDEVDRLATFLRQLEPDWDRRSDA
ncbi:MAG: DUF3151 family protein [Acidimicrobiales bacterium]